MKPTVSVVLCTYNGAAYLQPLLASLSTQSARIDELIVSDDASDDETVALLEAGARGIAERVIIGRRSRNAGPAQNFSEALSRASGDLIFLCDQDDVWAASKVQFVAQYMLRMPEVGLLQHDAGLIGTEGQTISGSLYRRIGVEPAAGADLFHRLLRRNLAPGCTLAVRRDLLELAMPVPAGFMHDEWLALVAAAFGRFRQSEQNLMAYRLHGGNTLGLRGIGAVAVAKSIGADAREARAAKISRFETLRERLGAVGKPPLPECQNLLNEVLVHLRTRQALPAGLVARARPIFEEWRSGRYRRYGSGSVSAFRDLLSI